MILNKTRRSEICKGPNKLVLSLFVVLFLTLEVITS